MTTNNDLLEIKPIELAELVLQFLDTNSLISFSKTSSKSHHFIITNNNLAKFFLLFNIKKHFNLIEKEGYLENESFLLSKKEEIILSPTFNTECVNKLKIFHQTDIYFIFSRLISYNWYSHLWFGDQTYGMNFKQKK